MFSDNDHMAARINVANSSDVNAVFQSVKEKYYTPPGIVVNVAGILKDSFLIHTTEEDFQEVLDVNLKVRPVDSHRS